MQEIIKLKLIDLGYNKKDYNLMGKMHWLDKIFDIIFITIPKLINSNIYIRSTYNFLVPCITNYRDYLKIKKKYDGLPITLEENRLEYLEWLESIKFYNFINQRNIEFNMDQKYWHIYSHNYKSVERIDFKLEKKSIKIKKLKI